MPGKLAGDTQILIKQGPVVLTFLTFLENVRALRVILFSYPRRVTSRFIRHLPAFGFSNRDDA